MQVRRLKEFGVTKGELARYMDALLKDSEQLAAMIDSVPSVDNLDFIMESDALSHTVMDQRQGHESLVAVTETVALEEVWLPAFLKFYSAAVFGQAFFSFISFPITFLVPFCSVMPGTWAVFCSALLLFLLNFNSYYVTSDKEFYLFEEFICTTLLELSLSFFRLILLEQRSWNSSLILGSLLLPFLLQLWHVFQRPYTLMGWEKLTLRYTQMK